MILKLDVEKRIKASLSGTELDVPSIRVGGYKDSKVPSLIGWTKGALEDRTIREILSDSRELNYSMRTGNLLGDDVHLIVIDIDLKVDTFNYISDRLLEIFKGYYIVKTPSGGYHIYTKVKSEDKFKSQHLMSLRGEKTTIEILGEKKKAMGPGSVIEGKTYKKIGLKMYKNSLSSNIISRDTFISKLKEAGLMLDFLGYRESEYDNAEVKIAYEGERSVLIKLLMDSRQNDENVKFISLIHGSGEGKPNTLLNSNGSVRCWRCEVTLDFDRYVRYSQDNSMDNSVNCGSVKDYIGKDSSLKFEKINSLEEFPLELARGSLSMIKAKAGSGKSTYVTKKLSKNKTPCLFICDYVRDADVLKALCPIEVNVQYGPAETRTWVDSHITIMTCASFALGNSNGLVNQFLKNVKKYGLVFKDEIDRLLDENVIGGHEAYLKLFREGWTSVGASATPDKMIGGLEKLSIPFAMYELSDNKKGKPSIKILLKRISGKQAGYISIKAFEEMMSWLIPKLPYKNGVILVHMNSSEAVWSPLVDYCIFRGSEENVNRKKILPMNEGIIDVPFVEKGITVILASTRLKSYTLEVPSKNFTYVFYGKYSSNIDEQHFVQNREHESTEVNPNWKFITSLISIDQMKDYEWKTEMYKEVGDSVDKLPFLREDMERVRKDFSNKIISASLSLEKMKYEFTKQEEVKWDGELTLDI